MAKYYVVVDIGCIHCEERTRVLGVFTDKAEAEKLATGGYFNEETSGQHSIEMLEVDGLSGTPTEQG